MRNKNNSVASIIDCFHKAKTLHNSWHFSLKILAGLVRRCLIFLIWQKNSETLTTFFVNSLISRPYHYFFKIKRCSKRLVLYIGNDTQASLRLNIRLWHFSHKFVYWMFCVHCIEITSSIFLTNYDYLNKILYIKVCHNFSEVSQSVVVRICINISKITTRICPASIDMFPT